MNEFADISQDENGDEYVTRFRRLDAAARARLPAKKRATYRPVERRDAEVDPLTQRRGPEVVTILKTKVVITTAAVDLTADERRAAAVDARAAAWRKAGLTLDAIARAVFNADTDPGELARLRALRDQIDQEHPLP